MRKEPFVDNGYYHIYNRGVDKRNVFLVKKDYSRFLLSMNLLNDKEDGIMIKWRDYGKCVKHPKLADFLKLSFRKREYLVDIISYCLMSNHFHFILKQNIEKGIERFLHKVGTSYTKYFNTKNKRNGSLFQGSFRASRIDSNAKLLRAVVYVSCNSEIHKVSSAEKYPWCSYLTHLENRKNNIVNDKILKEHFRNRQDLKEYVIENIRDFQERKQDQELFNEDD